MLQKLKIFAKNIINNNDFRITTESIIIKGIGLVLSFVLNIILVKNLGHEDYGRYIYFFSLINFFSMVSIFGMDKTILRYLSRYYISKDFANLNSVLKKTVTFVLFSSLLISFLILFKIILFYKYFSIQFSLIMISILFIPIKSLSDIYTTAIRAIGKIRLHLLINVIIKPLSLIIIITFLTNLINANLGSFDIFIYMAIINTLIIIFFIFNINKTLSKIKFELKNKKITKTIEVSFYLFFIQTISLFNTNIDNISLNYFTDLTQVSFFAVATKLSLLVGFSLNAMNVYLAPTISNLFFTNNFIELQNKLSFVARINLVFIFISTLAITIFGEFFLRLFGETMVEAYIVSLILSFGSIFHLCCGSVTYILIMTKFEKIAAAIFATSTFFNIFLNLMLIPLYGIVGCAIATTLSLIINNILSASFIIKKLKINPTVFSLIKC